MQTALPPLIFFSYKLFGNKKLFTRYVNNHLAASRCPGSRTQYPPRSMADSFSAIGICRGRISTVIEKQMRSIQGKCCRPPGCYTFLRVFPCRISFECNPNEPMLFDDCSPFHSSFSYS